MSLHWKLRLRQWRTVLALKGVKVSTWALVRAVLSGPVPADVWRNRMRTCLRCPVYDRDLKACRKRTAAGLIMGCSCFVPFLAFTAAPYTANGGCWAREITVHEGWPAFHFPSRWAKARAVWRFIFNL